MMTKVCKWLFAKNVHNFLEEFEENGSNKYEVLIDIEPIKIESNGKKIRITEGDSIKIFDSFDSFKSYLFAKY